MQYNRAPPPYPGHSKQLCQPGYRQSYSGSETSTDVSMSSTENLCLQTRQDPQGEETHLHHNVDYLQLDDNSILARLGMPAVEVKSTNSGTFYVTGSMPVTKDAIGPSFFYDYPAKQMLYYTSTNGHVQTINNNNHQVDFSCLPPPPEYPGSGDQQQVQQHCNQGNGPSNLSSGHSNHTSIHTSTSSELSADGQKQRPLCRSYELIGAQGAFGAGVQSSGSARSQPDLSRFNELKLVTISDDYHHQQQQQQQQQQQHVQQQQQQHVQQQQMPQLQHQKQKQHHEAEQQQQPLRPLLLHHQAQPTTLYQQAPQQRRHSPSTPPHELPHRPLAGEKDKSTGLPPIQPKRKEAGGVDNAAMASRALQMVELLSDENKALRDELNSYHRKISKLQQLEKEIQKVQEAHDSLVRSSDKRESLERTMRMKLQTEVAKLRESNKEFSERLEKTLAELTQRQVCHTGTDGTDSRQESAKKDAIIAKLVAQNRELATRNDQMASDMTLQQTTIHEQRAHIDVLDSALNNAQSNCIRMEEELYRRHYQSERIDQLQKALTQIQTTADKRDQLQQQLKRKYQLDINSLKAKFETQNVCVATSATPNNKPTYEELEAGIRERDTRLLELEAERSQWEHKYLHESALRELAIDAASQPKEARIAALEQNSVDSDRIIAEARSDKMKQLEEVYMANKRSSDLEVRVKTLQAQLAEKEALVRVFQKHSFCSSLGSVFSSPSHSPHPSYITLPISSISTSHSHNDITHRDTVVASAYMGLHTKTGSTNDNSPSSFSTKSPTITGGFGGTTSASAGVLSSSADALISSTAALSTSSLSASAGALNSSSSSLNVSACSAGAGASAPGSVIGATASQADTRKPSQYSKQSLLQLLAHKRLQQSESRSRSSSQSSSSSTSGPWQV